jgi:hypothetical protein
LNIDHSSRLWLPRTGQVTSYATGDDGYFQAGNPRATRFIDNGNGTISDRATGLMWVKAPVLIIPGATGVHSTNQIQTAHGNWANNHAYVAAELCKDTDLSTYWVCVSAHTSAAAGTFAADRAGAAAGKWRQTVWTASAADLTTPATFTWANAVLNCLGTKYGGSEPNALNYAGYTDWRLPNITELIVVRDPTVNAYATRWPSTFTNVGLPYTYWWSGSTGICDTTLAHFGYFYGLLSEITLLAAKTTLYYARPVRGGRLNANG